MERYDLCVIGGGPAGYAAAMRAIDFGKRVILIEKNKVGGAGVYNGALSSKTWWELSQKVRAVNESIVSVGRSKFGITWQEVIKTEQEALFDRKFQYSCHIKLLQEESMNNIFTYERGYGKIISANEVSIDKGKLQLTIWAENIIIATGSRPRALPNIPVDEKIIMTSDGIHQLEEYPKSLVVVGAGVIGCEYATIFANFGKTRVHLIDRADRILPFEDEDISKLVDNNLKKEGVVMHHNSSLERLEIKDGEVEYELSYEDGRREIIRVEKALLAIGRIPNVENIGLENVGIQMGETGRHIGDDDTRTNIPNIYAVGDASGRIKLVNMGEIEARHAVEKIFGNKKR